MNEKQKASSSAFAITQRASEQMCVSQIQRDSKRDMKRILAAASVCFLIPFSAATVLLNSISASFSDLPAKHAGALSKHGICGALYVADPLDGCSPLRDNASPNRTDQKTRLVLIKRGKCSFEEKILNAQIPGFQAVIIYDDRQNSDLVYMKVNHEALRVQAVFVSNMAGEILRRSANGEDGECCIYPPNKGRAWTVLAISLLSLALIITFLSIVFFAPRHWTLWRGSRLSHHKSLDAKLVNSLPSFTYTHFSQLNSAETCAICLEDYRLGEHLRLLPCQHLFHMSCVDNWLTKWGSSCPVCKLDIRTETSLSSSKVERQRWGTTGASTS